MAKIRIISPADVQGTTVEVDGHALRGLVAFTFHVSNIGSAPVSLLTLTFSESDIDVEFDAKAQHETAVGESIAQIVERHGQRPVA